MKRTRLERKTPLRQGTSELRRTPMPSSRCGLSRGGPIQAVSDKRRRQQPERRRVVNGLREAQQGRCARCGCSGLVLHGHERIGMAHGAEYLRPDVAVCDPCNSAIEDRPVVSAWNGWKISYKHSHDPALQPWEARALDGTIVDFSVLAGEAA